MALNTASPTLRTYTVTAENTKTFGRVSSRIRDHELLIDGPIQNGCPGELPTPGELILAAAASCGTELLQVLARDTNVPLSQLNVKVVGSVDREQQPRSDVTVFNLVEFDFARHGPSAAQAAELVAGFQKRCPVYGSLAVASQHVIVRHTTQP